MNLKATVIITFLGLVSIIVGLVLSFLTSVIVQVTPFFNVSGTSVEALKNAASLKISLISIAPFFALLLVIFICVIYESDKFKKYIKLLVVMSLISLLSVFLIEYKFISRYYDSREGLFNQLESGEYSNYLDSLKSVQGVRNIKFVQKYMGPDSAGPDKVEFEYTGELVRFTNEYKKELSKNNNVLEGGTRINPATGILDPTKSRIDICASNSKVILLIDDLSNKFSMIAFDVAIQPNNPKKCEKFL